MKTLLHISSSLFGEHGVSSQLAQGYADQWQASQAPARIIRRDLAADPLPHLDGERFAAFTTAAEQRSVAQQRIVAESDALIGELEQAHTLLLAVPMYNFGIPSTLKAWMDHVARAGRTFRYTAQGPEGLLKGKRAVLIFTRGGHYVGTAADQQSAYVKQFLAFIGITDVETIYAEGLALGAESKSQSLAAASARSTSLLHTASVRAA